MTDKKETKELKEEDISKVNGGNGFVEDGKYYEMLYCDHCKKITKGEFGGDGFFVLNVENNY